MIEDKTQEREVLRSCTYFHRHTDREERVLYERGKTLYQNNLKVRKSRDTNSV